MPTSYRHIVALGSSFASGLGIQPYADKAAKRSRLNYPSILADLLRARLTDRSVAGATTGHILHQRQRTGLRTHPPQIEHFPADADLVTLTAGGNDLGYIGSMIRLACAGRLTNPLVRPIAHYLETLDASRPSEADVARVSESLACIVDTVREAAPRAEVVLVEYLTLAGSETQRDSRCPAVRGTAWGRSLLRGLPESRVSRCRNTDRGYACANECSQCGPRAWH
ncbi:GDSL-type esterase/lipase family protein [Hoyosella sp. YIM 151337]|uniref:GDSL-type esterase/lipase family protein n=1 Tax=Hoyosella sp. YIM 151337 TaxID=2992742 RepID=UPI002235ADC5|nr:GDSL-type esterase/lipase family protein [Hoyosella sp. YIM 151337]MCW4354292.1 GDSL-type esterase/lipase family protein [Hoyosella sp. YIM 151337]